MAEGLESQMLGEQSHMDINSWSLNLEVTDDPLENTDDSDDEELPTYPEPVVTNIYGIQVRFPGTLNSGQSQIMEGILDSLANGKSVDSQLPPCTLIECPSDEDRRLATLAAVLSYCCRSHVVNRQHRNPSVFVGNDAILRNTAREAPMVPQQLQPIKIFYCTQSFEEIDEVIMELRKFKKTGYLEVLKMAVIGHHAQFCSNFPTQHSDNFSCSGRSLNTTFNFITTETIHLISKFRRIAQRCKFCPYKYCTSLEQISTANIVFCPKEFILSPHLRNGYRLNLSKAIVIFDDGSIENSCYSAGSTSISTEMLNLAAENLLRSTNAIRQETQIMNNELDNTLNTLSGLATSLQTFSRKVTEHHSTAVQVDLLRYLQESGLYEDGINKFLRVLVGFFLAREASDGHKLVTKTADICEFLTSTMLLMYAHQSKNDNKDLTVHLTKYKTIVSFKVVCNNPTIISDFIMHESMSVIIGSRCLPSPTLIRSELGVGNFCEDVIIGSQEITNCFFAYANFGPSAQVEFDLTHGDRNRSTVHEEAGEAVLDILKDVRGGAVVLFSSKDALEKITSCWESRENRRKSIMEDIKLVKHVYTEHSLNDKDAKRELAKFTERCEKPLGDRTGAVFFALHRGKVNEMIDAKAGLIRMFISIGMPYNSTKALNVEQKKVYYENNCADRRQSNQNWSDWYNADAFHIISKMFAKCVKKDQDWVGGIILDRRMFGKKNDFWKFIPKWVLHSGLKGYENWGNMKRDLQESLNSIGQLHPSN